MLHFLITAGGVALILFGIRFLRKGLDRLFGDKLIACMKRLTNSRIKAFLAGVGMSVMAPSSTTMSMLAAQSVQHGGLTTRQVFALMLGADIGLTVMVLLISMRLDLYAPILVLIGVLLFQYTERNRTRGIGQVVLSLGFIFMAIGVIKSAAGDRGPSADFIHLVDAASHYPFVLAVIAAAMSIAMQSSTATIGLVIGLGATQAINASAALCVVVGANVGIAVNALVVGWRQLESRRLGMANLLAKSVVAFGVLAAIPHVTHRLDTLALELDKQAAFAHTGFNILTAAIFLPLVTPMSKLVTKMMPARLNEAVIFGPKYLPHAPTDSLSLALSLSAREVMHMSEIAREMLDELWAGFSSHCIERVRHARARDNELDLLDTEIKRFLTRLDASENKQEAAEEILLQLRCINHLETMGDIIDKNLGDLAMKYESRKVLMPAGWREELDEFYREVRKSVLIAENVFNTRDAALTERLLRLKEFLAARDHALRDQHFARICCDKRLDDEASAIYLDMLTHLARINTSATYLAEAILKRSGDRTKPGFDSVPLQALRIESEPLSGL